MSDEFTSEGEKILATLPPEHTEWIRQQIRLAPPQTDEQIRAHQALILASRRRRRENP